MQRRHHAEGAAMISDVVNAENLRAFLGA
jgi:hypothetical protein